MQAMTLIEAAALPSTKENEMECATCRTLNARRAALIERNRSAKISDLVNISWLIQNLNNETKAHAAEAHK